MGAGWRRGLLVGGFALLFATAPTAVAGTRDNPEILDPIGDHPVDWLDIHRVWIEHTPRGFPVLRLEVPGFLKTPPDLGTGGMGNGAYFQVDFDLYLWNGTRIGNIPDQRAILAIEETMTLRYVCLWKDPYNDGAKGVGCWSNAAGGLHYGRHGTTITWELDFRARLGSAWDEGDGYRFENLTATSTFRAMFQDSVVDRAPETAVGPRFERPPNDDPAAPLDKNTGKGGVQLAGPQVDAGPSDERALAIGLAVVTGILLGIGRFVYKVGRFHILQWLVVHFLFTRIAKHEALNHERRSTILDFIAENPGVGFATLRRELLLGSGALVYHLRVLLRSGHLRRVQHHLRTRFFVTGAVVDGVQDEHLQDRILREVGSTPGISQHALTAVLGRQRKTVAYHLNKMVRDRRLTVSQHGRERHYVTTS